MQNNVDQMMNMFQSGGAAAPSPAPTHAPAATAPAKPDVLESLGAAGMLPPGLDAAAVRKLLALGDVGRATLSALPQGAHVLQTLDAVAGAAPVTPAEVDPRAAALANVANAFATAPVKTVDPQTLIAQQAAETAAGTSINPPEAAAALQATMLEIAGATEQQIADAGLPTYDAESSAPEPSAAELTPEQAVALTAGTGKPKRGGRPPGSRNKAKGADAGMPAGASGAMTADVAPLISALRAACHQHGLRVQVTFPDDADE